MSGHLARANRGGGGGRNKTNIPPITIITIIITITITRITKQTIWLVVHIICAAATMSGGLAWSAASTYTDWHEAPNLLKPVSSKF